MNHILQINSSIFAGAGQSSQLADAFVADLRAADPGVSVTRRDLATEPLPHLDAERFTAFITAPEERSDRQAALAAESQALTDELAAADLLVLGAPMYNFNIPSQLKAWFDQVARAGITFRYTESGPVGLLNGRRAVVFGTHGGVYGDADRETPYIRQFLGFLGMTDVDFITAEGLAMGDAAREHALEKARRESARLVAEQTATAA
jgi:FMN-dependent NADH-azoreductase